MPRSRIERIRERVRLRQYDMSAHAMEEMAEDGLDIEGVEQAILNGHIARIKKDDPIMRFRLLRINNYVWISL